ncbi:MAG: endo-1,4-beta-xylanase, partial [Bacteroidota bacterium]
LMEDYGLPSGEWLFHDNELANESAFFNWGSQRSTNTIEGQEFTRETRAVVNQVGQNPWNAGLFMNNRVAIAPGEKVLWTFYMRAEGSEGQVSFIAERNSGNFDKEVSFTVPIDQNWTQYFIPFEATLGNHPIGEFQVGFHLGSIVQDIRVGGFTAIKYPPSVNLEDLPSNIGNDNYTGSAADAAWRAPAADRIDQLRKANLNIIAEDGNGQPVSGAIFSVEMQQHDFAFGTAIKACRIANNNCFNPILQNNLINLDGQGHGFNWVVFENDLKWPAWEDEWLATNEEVVNAVTWLRDQGIRIRGHTLLWPGGSNLPQDVQQNASDTNYVLNRIYEHIDLLANYPGLAGQIDDWDVINETVTNTTLEDAFRGQGNFVTGREVYQRVFTKARDANPNVKLYLNDFVTLSLGNLPGSGAYNTLKRNLGEIMDNAPIDGIGFQGHIGGFPNGIPQVLSVYDDFYNDFGLEA